MAAPKKQAAEGEKEKTGAFELISQRPLEHPALLQYLTKRGIDHDIARQFLSQIDFKAPQVDASTSDLVIYDQRPQTRREHIAQIVVRFGYQVFTKSLVWEFVHWLTPSAGEDPRAEPLTIALIDELRRRRILIPARRTIELIVRHAVRRAENVRISALTRDLHPDHHNALDTLIARPQSGEVYMLSWLKAAPKSASVKSIKAVLDHLKVVREIGLPTSMRQNISVSIATRQLAKGQTILLRLNCPDNFPACDSLRRMATGAAVYILRA